MPESPPERRVSQGVYDDDGRRDHAERRFVRLFLLQRDERRGRVVPAQQREIARREKAEGASDAQKRWSQNVITRQVQHMALLFDDLLDISRITRGTLELRTEMTDVAATHPQSRVAGPEWPTPSRSA